jgi:uncharacterized membrane protein (UPF0182 family)
MRTPSSQPRSYKGLILFLTAFLGITFFWQFITLLTDWFWFQEVGYEQVFLVSLWSKIMAAIVFGLIFFLIFFPNLYLADRFCQQINRSNEQNIFPFPIRMPSFGSLRNFILSISLILSIIAALRASNRWENIQRFSHAAPFNLNDPLFSFDISFYVFKLPLLQDL